jgi:hypothetical protein
MLRFSATLTNKDGAPWLEAHRIIYPSDNGTKVVQDAIDALLREAIRAGVVEK